jgi:hypothetical protein
MNKQELRKILKPLVKECIKEVIFEDGILSGIISEVVQGIGAEQINEAPKRKPAPIQNNHQKEVQLNEQRRKMMDAIGKEAYNGVNLFEGTTPTPASGQAQHGPLSGTDPSDPGVDISSLMGNGRAWKKLAGN